MKKLLVAGALLALLLAGSFGFISLHHKKVAAVQPTGGGSTLTVGQYHKPDYINTEEVLNDVNKYREANGLPALTENPAIMQAAQDKCNDMIKYNYYAHVNPVTGERGIDFVFNTIRVKGAGENLAGDDASIGSQALVNKWINSPEHKANMLNPSYTDTGVATCTVPLYPKDTTVVQQFAEL